MRKKSGREKYLDSEWNRLDNAPPPPDWLLNASGKAKREKNVSNEEKPGSNEKKSGRRLYEERVWREVDKMPPPPDWWPLEGRSKKNLISSQKTELNVSNDVATSVATPVATNGGIRELQEKIKSILEQERGKKTYGRSIKDRLLCYTLKVRVSLSGKRKLMELARELGVNQSEAHRFCISMCHTLVVKKEHVLWQ